MQPASRHTGTRWRAPGRASPPRSIPLRASIRARLRPRSRGQALVEFALILPVFLLLALAAVDLGRVFYSQITVTNAARAGAVEASYHPTSFTSGSPCSATNRVMCAATKEATGSFVTVATTDIALSCSPACATGANPANRVTVTVTGHFTLVTPLIAFFTGTSNLTLQSTAVADIVTVPTANGGSATPTPTPVGATPTPTATPVGATPTPTPVGQTPAPTATPVPCPSPIVNFTTSQQNKNKPVVFTSTSTPTSGSCAISFWRWDFGDGQTDAGAVPSTSHDYGVSGATFNVTLTVTYPDGTAFIVRSVTTR